LDIVSFYLLNFYKLIIFLSAISQ